MTDEEVEDMFFRRYLEAKYYQALFDEMDRAILLGNEDDDEAQS